MKISTFWWGTLMVVFFTVSEEKRITTFISSDHVIEVRPESSLLGIEMFASGSVNYSSVVRP